MLATLETIISWTANLLQIATALLAIWVIWRARRRIRRTLAALAARPPDAKIMALAIGIERDISGQVEAFLKAQGLAIELDKIVREGWVGHAEYPEILNELRTKMQAMTDAGVAEVHLFYKGPLAIALAMGSMLDNWVPVRIYEFETKTGTYRYVWTLGKGAVLDVLEELTKETADLIKRHALESGTVVGQGD